MDTTMRASVLTRPQTIELQERPVPEPGPDEALVRVGSVGGATPALLDGLKGLRPGGTAVMVGHGEERISLPVQDIRCAR